MRCPLSLANQNRPARGPHLMPQQEREAKQRKGKRARAGQPFTPGGAWRGASGATAARAGRRKTGRGPARCLPGPPQRVRRARQKAERGRQPLARRLDARARVKPAKPTKKALPVQKRPAGIAKGPAGRKIRFSVRVFRSGLPPPPGAASGSRARGAWHEPCPRGACFTKLPSCMNQQVSGHGRGQARIIGAGPAAPSGAWHCVCTIRRAFQAAQPRRKKAANSAPCFIA